MEINYIDNQTEKIYASIDEFFEKEYLPRRRFDPNEGGIQAVGIITKDSIGFKITENNGTGPHGMSEINLYRYLKGKKEFYSENANYFKAYKNDGKDLLKESSAIRFVGSPKETIIVVTSFIKNNEYQINNIKQLLAKCMELTDKGINVEFGIGLHASNLIIDPGEETLENIYKELEYLNKTKTR